MIDEARIDAIVQQVMAELRQGERVRHGPLPEPLEAKQPPPPAPALRHGDNLFPDVDSAITAARRAYLQLCEMPLSVREQMIAHIRRVVRENAQLLAYEAWQETGMGRYEDKIQKNLLNANKVPGTEILTPTAWSGDGGLTLVEYAPYGVIGAIIPSTNPTSSVICNTIGMVAAGNAVVFNAHPGARACSNHAVQLIHEGIVEAGGPPNLVCAIAEPTIETAQQIMHHPNVQLLAITGGEGVVRVAMQSGKRAVCAGPGNPPVVVDETADIEQAGRDIVIGGSFDNNIVCTTEKETFAVSAIHDELIQVMTRSGAVKINTWQFERLWKAVTVKDRGPRKYADMNKGFIGKSASVLLAEIGISAGPEVRQIVVDVDENHPVVWSEQMMPIMPVVKAANADAAIDLAVEAEHGFRHTAVMHSKNLDNLSRMAREIDCSIFVKNGPCLAGLGYGGEGYCSFTIASPTGEGITGPVSFSRRRRCTLVDSFRIV